jgi:hypothetical protein
MWNADMRRIASHLAFDDYIKLTRRFHFLVALGLPGSGTKAFSEYIQFQCNCGLFWRRSACPHALLLGTYLKKSSGGFIPKPILRRGKKLPSRVGVEKVGREKAKEYCRLAHPTCPPSLRTSTSSRGSVPSSRTPVTVPYPFPFPSRQPGLYQIPKP